MVASTTSSVSCGAPSSRPAITRRTFASSSIRFVCVCRRPAVSTITTSRPRGGRRLDRVVGDRGRVAALRRADEVGAGALAPRPRAAPRRRRGRCRRPPGAPSARAPRASRRACRSSSSCRCRYADDEDHRRPRGDVQRPGLAEHRRQLLLERSSRPPRSSSRRTSSAVAGTPTSAPISASSSRSHAFSSFGSNPANCCGQRPPGAGQRVAQPSEETRLLVGRLVGRPLAEQLPPRAHPRQATEAATASSRGSRRETICETPSPPIVTP